MYMQSYTLAVIGVILITLIIILCLNYRKKIFKFYKSNIKKLKKAKTIRHLFLIYSISLGILSTLVFYFVGISIIYSLHYFAFIYVTYGLIREISETSRREHLLKKQLFNFIIVYFLIMIVYIHLFASLYSYTFRSENGYFLLNEKVYIIDSVTNYFISGLNFMSYDIGLVPVGYMKFILLIQLFVSQVMILGFFFIIFSQLLGKIDIDEGIIK